MKITFFLPAFLFLLWSCGSEKIHDISTILSNASGHVDSISYQTYQIKDTTSTLYVSYHECTECLDALGR